MQKWGLVCIVHMAKNNSTYESAFNRLFELNSLPQVLIVGNELGFSVEKVNQEMRSFIKRGLGLDLENEGRGFGIGNCKDCSSCDLHQMILGSFGGQELQKRRISLVGECLEALRVREFDVSILRIDCHEQIKVLLSFDDVTYGAGEDEPSVRDDVVKSQKFEELGIFAAGVAHEFNNLLGAIMLNLQFAQMELDGGDLSAMGEGIHNSLSACDLAADLVKQVLEYSKESVVKLQNVCVSELVGEIERLLVAVTKGVNGGTRGVFLDFELGEELARIEVCENSLKQVLINLVSNAAYAVQVERTNISETKGRVLVKTGMIRGEEIKSKYLDLDVGSGEYVFVSVVDDGVGIAPENIAKIFGPLFTTKGMHGTGLGLSIVKALVEDNGGKIGVTSVLGEGTSMEVFFPVAVQSEILKRE